MRPEKGGRGDEAHTGKIFSPEFKQGEARSALILELLIRDRRAWAAAGHSKSWRGQTYYDVATRMHFY